MCGKRDSKQETQVLEELETVQRVLGWCAHQSAKQQSNTKTGLRKTTKCRKTYAVDKETGLARLG